MIGLIILTVLFCLLAWILISPIVMELDSRIPRLRIKWLTICDVKVWYQEEWWLSFSIFFFTKTIRFSEIKGRRKKRKPAGKKSAKKPDRTKLMRKVGRIVRTFRIQEWQLAVDTGNPVQNAWLYPVNYLPYTNNHLHVNFIGDNYLLLRIRNRPWKIVYTIFR